MALFSISDLHLSLSTPKPMDVFGHRWQGYISKLEKSWRSIVSENDTVVIPGDISWAMHLEEAEADFRFIDSLPGKKLIGKGNHDYWWDTMSKMRRIFDKWGVTTIDFLHNNAFIAEGHIVCGTRGWFTEERLQSIKEADFTKMCARETLRLKASLDAAMALRGTSDGKDMPILVYLHFPPAFGDFECSEFLDMMANYGVAHCYYGHIHGKYNVPHTEMRRQVPLTMISADYLNFIPLLTKISAK